MNELLNALTRADQICQKANVHWERGAAGVEAANKRYASQMKLVKIICFVIGFFLMSLPATLGFLLIAADIGGYFWYKSFSRQTIVGTAEAAAEAENNKAQRIFENNIEDMNFLPVDYWYPMATGYMIKMVGTQRADTLKEALAMYDAQLHRWKVEEANAQMVEQQMIQSAHLKSIKNSSRVNAAANVANTIFNIANSL